MIGWLQPSAFWGLGLVTLPIAVHLLRTRRARRVPFPAVRFVQPSRTASVRLRPPSDLLLLALRLSIVAAAVAAAAQPLWLSASRVAAWDARVARAVVVDTSGSGIDARRALAEAELSGDLSHRIEHPDLREAIRRARAWLRSAPPARREIVVISPFTLGAFTPAMLVDVDRDVGLRFVPITVDETAAEAGRPLLAAPGLPARVQRTRVTPEGTHVRVEPMTPPGEAAPPAGVRVHGDSDGAVTRRILTTLAGAGTAAGDGAQPIALIFEGTDAPGGTGAARERWMIETLAAIERDAELRALSRDTAAAALPDDSGWTVLLADAAGRALVRAAAQEGELLLQAPVPESSYFAAALARAALAARAGPPAIREIVPIPRDTLDAWSRQPGPVEADAWKRADTSDARWAWLIVVALLAAEGWLRVPARPRNEESRAAA